MVSDFLRGASYVTKGCREFYGDRKAWKYAAFPLGIIFLIYLVSFWAILKGAGKIAAIINNSLAGLPNWLVWLQSCVSALSCIMGILIALLLTGTTVCTIYELFGSLFFDSLTAYYEQKKFGTVPRRLSFSGNLKYCRDSFSFAIRTAVCFIFLFILSFFFPFAGQLILVAVMGYYMAVSFMICSGNNNSLTIAQLRAKLKGKKMAVLGFGITSYLLLTIPFATLILLPGLVLGGSELFNREYKLQSEDKSSRADRKEMRGTAV